MKGTITAFANQLVKIGYKITSAENTLIVMSGKFVGKDCEIYIAGTPKTRIIWKVTVYLPEETSWSHIKSQYFDLKMQFETKYGVGKSFEFFSSPFEPGDGYEMTAIRAEKCTYATFWYLDNGGIHIQISKYAQLAIH